MFASTPNLSSLLHVNFKNCFGGKAEVCVISKCIIYIIGHQNSCYWLLFFPPFQIEMLPDGLFQCKKLQCLLLGRNSLMSLSPHVGELSNLTHLELVGNYLETLPPELEACQSLKRSCLVVEENLLNTLPLPVTERLQSCLDKC